MGSWVSTAELRDATPRDIRIYDVKETGRELGSGAYGSVVQVRYKGTLCACKRLHDLLASAEVRRGESNRVVAKFRAECERMSQLRHPNIVQFMGIYFSRSGDDFPSLVMELLPFSLDEFLKKNKSIPSFIKTSILLDVSLALLYLHKQTPPIIHRDISVYNVLLTRGLRAKLSDLGVARVLQHDMPPLSLVPGHQAYMPPEAFMENPNYDESLDVFSFGKLIVNVESGKCPDDDDVKWGKTVDSADVIAGPLKDLAFRCMEADPRKRPSIDEIVDDIEKKHELDPVPFQHSVELLIQLEAKEKEISTLKERPHQVNGGNHFDSTDKKIPALEALHNVPLSPPAANQAVSVQTLPRTRERSSGRPQSTYDLASEKTLPAHHERFGTWGHNRKPRRIRQVNERDSKSDNASGATPELAVLLARRRQWEQK